MISLTANAAIPDLGTILGGSHTETDTGAESFYLTDNDGGLDDATAFLYLENAGYADYNSFGIYDISNGTSFEIFNGTESPLLSATLSWDTLTNSVSLVGQAVSAIIDDTAFGFYIDAGPNQDRFFSESILNPDGEDMLATFDVGSAGYGDLLGANYILAWEDILAANGGDGDYNDMVIAVSDIGPNFDTTTTSVPEPGFPMLVGLGLIGIGLNRKLNTL